MTASISHSHTSLTKEIRLHQGSILPESLRAAAEKYNSVAPIFSLPPEVLIDVFVWSVSEREYVYPTRQPHLPHLTAIFRYWRTVALSTPGIWTSINTHNLAAFNAYLLRSRNARISIHWEFGTSSQVSVLKEALEPHLGRVRALFLEFPSQSSMSSFFPLRCLT